MNVVRTWIVVNRVKTRHTVARVPSIHGHLALVFLAAPGNIVKRTTIVEDQVVNAVIRSTAIVLQRKVA